MRKLFTPILAPLALMFCALLLPADLPAAEPDNVVAVLELAAEAAVDAPALLLEDASATIPVISTITIQEQSSRGALAERLDPDELVQSEGGTSATMYLTERSLPPEIEGNSGEHPEQTELRKSGS